MILGGQGCQIIIVLLLLENDKWLGISLVYITKSGNDTKHWCMNSYLGYLCYLYLEVLIISYPVKYQVQIVFSKIKWIACNQADLHSREVNFK